MPGPNEFGTQGCTGEIDCVPPTPEISVRNRVYVVLRAGGDTRPRFFRTFSEFKGHTGRLSSGTVCHGFPTEGEARTYVRAAGLDFPAQPQQP